MLIILKSLAFIPFWILYPLGDFFSLILRLIYRKEIVFNNLQIAFPNHSEKELSKIRRQYYRNFLQVIAEVVKTSSISAKELKQRVKLVNPELLEEEYNQGNSVLMFASHFCNWEWAAHAVTLQTSYNLDPVYKVQSNPKLDRFILDIRSRFGGQPIPKENTARNILRNKDKQRAIGFVADQKPYRKSARVWLNFLGKETAFFRGGILMPYMSQFPCYFMKVVRVKRGYYEMEAIKIGQPKYEKNDPSVIKNYIREVEKQIAEHPADWLWSHRRWVKKRDEDEELLAY
ncbi:MAG: lysophospholipid acyltransferase family protein [Bacteroidota bacterium]